MSDNIVCLDGYTLNPGDLSWSPFEELGNLVVYDRTPPDKIVSRAKGAPFVLTNKTPLSADTLSELDGLRYIGVLATGYNIVDVETAAARDITVTNVPTYGTDSVAQHTTALLLQLVRPLAIHDEAVKAGKWSQSPDWCFSVTPIDSLAEKTLGIVGIGRIGLAVARIATAMGMRIIAYDTYWPDPSALEGLSVQRVSLDELFASADAISLHCPLTEDNYHLVNAKRLTQMKPSALLINTSRGPLIDTEALTEALMEGTIAGAGIDVLEEEPPPAGDALLEAPNCVITPHIAWYAKSSRKRLMAIAAANLESFQKGTAVNKVA